MNSTAFNSSSVWERPLIICFWNVVQYNIIFRIRRVVRRVVMRTNNNNKETGRGWTENIVSSQNRINCFRTNQRLFYELTARRKRTRWNRVNWTHWSYHLLEWDLVGDVKASWLEEFEQEFSITRLALLPLLTNFAFVVHILAIFFYLHVTSYS